MKYWLPLLVAGCMIPTDLDDLPPDAIEQPRALYRTVYEQVADCAGVESRWNIGSLRIFTVPGNTPFACPPNEVRCMGWWVQLSASDRRIYTTGEPQPGNLFRHEALHDLYRTSSHGRSGFGRCDR